MLLLLACRDEAHVGGFRAADEVAFTDGAEGRVRAHYSDRGPNAADQTDLDEDGVPDVAEQAAADAEAALRFYSTWGLAAPVPEAEVGLDGAGGSDALDVALVKRPRPGVVTDACEGRRCAVHLERPADEDYPEMAGPVFRAVLAAYDAREPEWLVEGAAGYAATMFAGGDWIGAVDGDAWLAAPECGLADIDGVALCSAAAAGTGLLWWHFADEVGDAVLLDTIAATVTEDGVDALAAGLAMSGASLVDEWPGVAARNLATGPRSQGRSGDGYWFGGFFEGVVADAEGEQVRERRTFAPLSARYFRVDHAGGPFGVAVDGDAGPLVATVHPVEDGAADGPFSETLGPFPLDAPLALDVPAGGVWVSVSHPDPAEGDVRVRLCLGPDADPCAAGCASVPGGTAWGALAALALLRRRQKPGPPRTSQAAPR